MAYQSQVDFDRQMLRIIVQGCDLKGIVPRYVFLTFTAASLGRISWDPQGRFQRDSNPQRSGLEPPALTIELWKHHLESVKWKLDGFYFRK